MDASFFGLEDSWLTLANQMEGIVERVRICANKVGGNERAAGASMAGTARVLADKLRPGRPAGRGCDLVVCILWDGSGDGC